jgi:DNA-binding response OmpR family regulator
MTPTILIIDDEKHLCSVLSAYLSEHGFETREANDLTTARKMLTERPLPDLIITDVMLGDGNGILFTREVRQAPATSKIPMIVMSAICVKPQDKIAGLELGADDYIAKPFDLKEVKLRIESILKRQGSQPHQPNADVVSSLKNLLGKGDAPIPSAPTTSTSKATRPKF